MREYYDCFLTAVVVGFERLVYTVGEEDGQVELCVNITVPSRQDIGTVTFNITVETQNGSAGISYNRNKNAIYFTLSGGMLYVMYNLPHSYIHISNSTSVHGIFCSQWPRGCFSVLVTDDDFRNELFQATASFSLPSYWPQSLNMHRCVNILYRYTFYVMHHTWTHTVSNDDYTSVSMTLSTFTSQRPRQCFSISITNDAITEQTEDFTTRLTLIPDSVTTINASRIVVGPPETTVQITDSDGK